MALTAATVPSLLIRGALLPLALLVPALERSAQAQLVWTTVDPSAPQPSGWGGTVVTESPPPAAAGTAYAAPRPSAPSVAQPAAATRWASMSSPMAVVSTPAPAPLPASRTLAAAPVTAWPAAPVVTAVPSKAFPNTAFPSTATPNLTVSSAPLTAQVSQPQAASASSPDQIKQLRDRLRIEPIVKRSRPWPSPSLNPGVPSAFIAKWGDVFVSASAATPGNQRDGVADGSWNAGFGLGDPVKAVALEVSGGCGSVKDFCANGSFTARLGRLLVNGSQSRLSLAAAWQNFAQWGNEGRQDNIYYGALSYAVPLQAGRPFAQTFQINAGVGNSQYAPFVSTDSESQIGAFASVGVELTKYLGLSAGWSGRGANAQLSLTPFRNAPITINLLGADLFNQTPAGTVGVLSVSWGTNFATPSF